MKSKKGYPTLEPYPEEECVCGNIIEECLGCGVRKCPTCNNWEEVNSDLFCPDCFKELGPIWDEEWKRYNEGEK